MTPRYTWTPASEPPDTDRMILVYGYDEEKQDRPYWSEWMHVCDLGFLDGCGFTVTHWRDVDPPEAE